MLRHAQLFLGVHTGVELSSKKKKVAWPADPNDEVEDDLEKTLELRQVSWERKGAAMKDEVLPEEYCS